MSAATGNRTPPVDQITVDHVLALANEIADLNLAMRHLLGCDIKDMPTAGEVLTKQIDNRLAELIQTLEDQDEDKPPLKTVES
jgi:hypothetical protein